ncbi:DNase I-like protein, partial [Metschnikowia bicuspidata var. bicuspidata NRRL YB-4993]
PGLPGSALTAPQSVAVVPEPAYPEIAGPSPQTAAGHVAFRFYSHNVKNGLHDDLVPGEMPWDMRKRLVINSIKFNAVANSVVFLQEPLKFQLDDILADLNYLSAPGTPEWVAVGSGRVDGKDVGEHVPILFRPAEWTVVFNDTFWLNDGATRMAVAGWDAKYPRIATYATLKHALSGHHINVANTHFDHKGKTARRESALLLVAKLRSLNLWPLFVMGDLNSQPGDASHREMTKAFVDVHDHVPDFSRYGHLDYTVTGFSGKYLKDAKRIDYIFAPKDTRRLSEPMCADPALPYSLQVVGYGLLHSKFGGVYMSDHRPVVADFVMKGCDLGQATDA